MHKFCRITLAVTAFVAPSLGLSADKTPDLYPTYKPSQQSDFERSAPRIERGQLVNPAPVVRRDPSPVEKTAKKIIDAPIRPDAIRMNDGTYVPGVRLKVETR